MPKSLGSFVGDLLVSLAEVSQSAILFQDTGAVGMNMRKDACFSSSLFKQLGCACWKRFHPPGINSSLGSIDISSLKESSKLVGVLVMPLDPGRSANGSEVCDFLLRIDRPSSARPLREI